MGCGASSRFDAVADSKQQRGSSTTQSGFTDLSLVECSASVAVVQPSIWARAAALDARRPAAPAAQTSNKGQSGVAHGVPNHADGTGAEVIDAADSGELRSSGVISSSSRSPSCASGSGPQAQVFFLQTTRGAIPPNATQRLLLNL
eukprot:scaffold10403_cov101-Isochrysis_galbana.AAC.2